MEVHSNIMEVDKVYEEDHSRSPESQVLEAGDESEVLTADDQIADAEDEGSH